MSIQLFRPFCPRKKAYQFKSCEIQYIPHFCLSRIPTFGTMASTSENIQLSNTRPASTTTTTSRETSSSQGSATVEIEQPSLPPTDTGKDAWLVLAGCSLIQIPVWGIYQHHYDQ